MLLILVIVQSLFEIRGFLHLFDGVKDILLAHIDRSLQDILIGFVVFVGILYSQKLEHFFNFYLQMKPDLTPSLLGCLHKSQSLRPSTVET